MSVENSAIRGLEKRKAIHWLRPLVAIKKTGECRFEKHALDQRP